MENKKMNRWADSFELFTKDKDELMQEVHTMEENSQWVPGIQSKAIRVVPIPSEIEANIVAQNFGLDYDQVVENISEGTKLLLDAEGQPTRNISGICRNTLFETAKLFGSSLGRLHQIQLAENLNNSLAVARGQTLMLVRHDKVMALHGDNYVIMPISALVSTTEQILKAKFGAPEFKDGYISNAYFSAYWTMPDAQNDLLDKYQKMLDNAGSSVLSIDFMPAVRLSSSDTSHSAATLRPMFIKSNGVGFVIGEGISVKHEKSRTGVYGIDLFEKEADAIFAKFNESIENLAEMAETPISNPVNCVVGILNYLNRSGSVIPRKFGDSAREAVEILTVNSPVLSMHDIYLAMFEAVGAARIAGARAQTLVNIEESLAKVLTLDWSSFDVGGVVAWGGKGDN